MLFKGRENSRRADSSSNTLFLLSHALFWSWNRIKVEPLKHTFFDPLSLVDRRGERQSKSIPRSSKCVASKIDRSLVVFVQGRRGWTILERCSQKRVRTLRFFLRTIVSFIFRKSSSSSKRIVNRYSFIFSVYYWKRIFVISIIIFKHLVVKLTFRRIFGSLLFPSTHQWLLKPFPIIKRYRLEKLRPYCRATRKTRWIRVN